MSARRCPACGYTDPHPVVTHQECRKRAREAALQRALDDGRPLDRKCPSCGRLDVEYNGNYCCRSCDWAISSVAAICARRDASLIAAVTMFAVRVR